MELEKFVTDAIMNITNGLNNANPAHYEAKYIDGGKVEFDLGFNIEDNIIHVAGIRETFNDTSPHTSRIKFTVLTHRRERN